MKYRKGTAVGKLILLGEHGVLYGGGGIAVPLPQTACRFSFKSASEKQWHVNPQVPEGVLASLKKDWFSVTKNTALEDPVFEFTLNFRLPAQAGFGLSAAWSVALVRAVRADLKWSEAQCLSVLQQLEDAHHGGKASGIDHLAIWYEHPQKLEEGGIKPWALASSWLQDLVIFSTGAPTESTAAMIKKSALHAQELVLEGSALEDLDRAGFNHLINDYGRRLEVAGLVNPSLAAKFEEFRDQGGVVKISGAGGYVAGSGAALAWHEDEQRLRDFVRHFTVIG